MSIFTKTIPVSSPDQCGEIYQNISEDCIVKDISPAFDIQVLYPPNIIKTQGLPLAGGSVLKLNYKNSQYEAATDYVRLFSEELSSLNNFKPSQNDIENLAKLRLIFNSILRKVGRKESVRKKSNLPQILITTYKGDDSSFITKTTQYIAGMITVCELNYIPLEIIEKIIELAFQSLDQVGLGNTVGSSGVKFSNLGSGTILEQVMEIFPIYNIPEKDIDKATFSTAAGGFYTFDPASETIYIKMPDLSGKNSFGVSSDIFTDRNFYIEAIYNNLINRVKLEGFSIPPSIDFVGEVPTEFSDGGELEFVIESNKDLAGASAYLSIINTREINISSLDTSGEALELFSAPILTAPVFTLTNLELSSIIPESTIDLALEKNKTYNELVLNSIDQYFTLPINLNNQINNVGLSTSVPQIDLSYQLGEMNRPELALFNSERDNPKNSNDDKYTNPKLMEARELLIGNRPKIYNENQIPYLWIVADSLSQDLDGNYNIKFSSSKFGNINKSANPNIKFMLYVLDGSGQLARAPKIINIETESPSLLGIDPDGFIGSREISPNKKLKIVLSGENLTNVKSILIQDENKIFTRTFSKGQNDDYVLSVSSGSLIFKTFKNIIETPFNLTPSTTYLLSAITEYGRVSQDIKFYVSDGANNLIFRSPLEPKLGADEFVFESGTQTISNIPVKPGQNALIKIKSKHRYFNGEYGLFAYIGLDIENIEFLKRIDLPTKILDVNFAGKFISIASTFEFEFSPSFIGKDFYKISNNKAGIKLPGDNFKDYNLASLINSNKICYLVITNKPISELASSGQPINSDNFSILNLGTSQSQAFVYPPYIYGMAAILPGEVFKSNFDENSFSNFSKVRERLQASADASPTKEKISAFEKISKLGILFYGDGDNNYKKRTDFYIGTKKINKYLSGQIETVDEQVNLQLAIFENIKISEQGEFPVYISKKNKPYNITVSSQTVIRTQTYDISNSFTKIADGLALIPERLPGPTSSFENFDNIVPARGSGIPFLLKDSIYNFINPISIASNFNIILKDYSNKSGTERSFLKNIAENDITALDSKFIYIPSGTTINSEDYLDSLSNGLAYLKLVFNEPQKISFNMPEISSIDEGANIISPITKPDKIKLIGGREYTAIVKSSNKDFILLFDNNVVVNPKSVKSLGNNEWRVVFRSPKKLISLKCPIVCVSITNATRKRSKFLLGDRFVIDVDSKMKSILDGTVKNKIPDRSDLINIIKDFPLRFVNIKLDLPSIPTDLINSFCDMSFHLSADLKIALNGFQILMTPIQIIFCIIDVICALLNPPKLARAVIRLFQCLYDLILILPVISVPVMFLQLIIHLLILLECLLGKILTIVLVVNEIINIIAGIVENNVLDYWEALKSLEELLSEYLFDLNVNLSVLDPIVSILAIFLQLLGLTFRFPCSITDDMDQYFCLDGTMVGGLIVSKMINSDGSYNLANLIPVGQSYSEKTLNKAILDNTSDPLVDPTDNDLCAIKTDSQTYLESMNVDQQTLRSTFAGATTADGNFNLTFSISATKSRKGLGSPDLVEFQFKEKGRNGFFNKKKIIEPDQTLDGFLFLTKNKNNELTIETGNNKNLISPVDSYEFITISDDTASAKPLVLNVEIPIEEINPETGQKEIVGVETIPRTFDNVPSFAIVDEQNFVYFVEPNGIKLKNGVVDSIVAKVINTTSASKIKFDKEDVEIDTDSDGYSDDEAPVFEFPQLYFFDMRSIAIDIETKCGIDFFNNELLQNDPDAIIEIVKKAQDCVLGYQNHITDIVNSAQLNLTNGIIPEPISISALEAKGAEINKCLNEVIDDICIYVVNTLNSQFKILEDNNEVPLEEFPITEITPELADDFEITGPTLTGAREYSDGIGDSADIKTGNFATIQITPRDSYDNVMPGDFSEKIIVEVVSDTTGAATFIETNGAIITKDGENYFAKITSTKPGIVKIRAKICEKTIQAVTYAEVANQINNENNSKAVDCVPDAPSAIQNPEPALGQLAKIDRILTIFFIEGSKVITANIDDGLGLAKADPQAFGTGLEN